MADAVISFISKPIKDTANIRPTWKISHERLKHLYSVLGAIEN
jgi:hypothetical protein